MHNVLITGASGYLGGTFLARLPAAALPAYGKLYASLRNPAQAEHVKQYGAEPLVFDTADADAVREAIVGHGISVVFYLNDAATRQPPLNFLRALAQVKKDTGREVHFVFTTGAKLFSRFAGAPSDRPLLDNDPDLYKIQREQDSKIDPTSPYRLALNTNTAVIDEGERLGVRSCIFAPCIVYGEGEGFGNKISIQTVAVIKAAKATGRVYKVDQGRPTWPVCHIHDNTALYIAILRSILQGDDIDHGRQGYYLAASGSVAWDDLYAAVAAAMKRRGAVADETVLPADQAALETMAAALKCPVEMVRSMVGEHCTFTAEHGKMLGWTPQFPPAHILEAADAEVELVLKNLA